MEEQYNSLTDREREIAHMIAGGANCHDIAQALSISVKTFDTHRQHIMKKFDFDVKQRRDVMLTRALIRLGKITLA